jgi:hypothetical protein
LGRGDAVFFDEKTIKVAVVIKTATKSYILGGLGGYFKMVFTFFQLFMVYILDRSHFIFVFKQRDYVIF